MKIFTAIVLLATIYSCNDKLSDYKKFEPTEKYEKDSLRIINQFIDSLPDRIKYDPYIGQAYKRNLLKGLEVNEKARNLLR